jgi:serine/threonine-protein kinase PpkA
MRLSMSFLSVVTVLGLGVGLGLATARRADAQDAATAAAELRGLIDTYRAAVEAQEQRPPVEGSEAAVRRILEAEQARLSALEAEQKNRSDANAINAKLIQSLLPAFPRTTAAPVDPVVQPAPLPDPAPQAPQAAGTTAGGGAAVVSGFGALQDPYLGGDRRVLTLPGAIVRPLKADGRNRELPVFSILYVLGRTEMNGSTYLAVGRTADLHEGWIDETQTEEWNSMLVLQFAPLGKRRPAVFWSDPEPLRDILDSHFTGPQEAQQLYVDIAEGNYDGSAVVAIEPARPVAADTRPYFMPIIGHVPAQFDDIDRTEVFLLELAMVNLQSREREQVTSEEELRLAEEKQNTEALKEFRTGVIFVVDSTLSMGPYIDGVRDFMRSFRQTTVEQGFDDRMGFGLIGYRDTTANDKRVEYTTRTFLPLEMQVQDDSFEGALKQIKPSSVSTTDWREDALAGIEDALTQTDWSEYDARYVVLVTDAGPRVLGDALARNAALGPRSIGRLAERQGVSLSIVHILTDAGKQDHRAATSAYAELTRARGGSVPSYFTVRGDGPARFSEALTALARQLAEPLNRLRQGEVVDSEPRLKIFEGDTFLALEGIDGAPVVISEDRGSEALADGIVTELFRFQQEYLGELDGGEAPDFYRAWVADRDLVDPRVASMDVKVLITRDQLSDFTSRLRDLVTRLDTKQTGALDAFSTIVDVSSRASLDPNAAVGQALMPDYIARLPYKSDFLSMELDEWAGLGPQQQGEILKTVRDRISLFEDIARTEAGWLALPGRDGGLAVYPLALDDLP